VPLSRTHSWVIQRATGLLVTLAVTLLTPALVTGAQSVSSRSAVQEVKQRLTAIRRELVAIGKTTQDQEAVVVRAEARLLALETHHANRHSALAALHQNLSHLTITLQRLARRPPAAILTRPGTPIDMAHAMMLVRTLVSRVKIKSDTILDQLAEIENLRLAIARQRERFRRANVALDDQRARLEALILEKNKLWQQGSTARPETTKELVRSVDTLGDLLVALRNLRRARQTVSDRLVVLNRSGPVIAETKPIEPIGEPSSQGTVSASVAGSQGNHGEVPTFSSIKMRKGNLTFPTSGRLVTRFGEPDDLGVSAKGIALATRPGAGVVATYDGNVIYAGLFRGYGGIIIIEHGEGFHTLLAGLERIDVRTGHNVLAGEPVGAMGDAAIKNTDLRRLYVELRKNGKPLNPLAWLTAQRNVTQQ